MMGLGLPPMPDGAKSSTASSQKMITETDDLRTTKLAFILGRRSSEKAGVSSARGDGSNLEDANGNPVTSFNNDAGA